MSDSTCTAYIPGEVARLELRITAPSGAAADPGALLLKIKPPTGSVVTLTYGVDVTLVRDALGVYHYFLALPLAGQWAYRWELSGANAGAVEGIITVAASAVI